MVGYWLTMVTQHWNRNRVYSVVVTPMLHWCQHHIVNPALMSEITECAYSMTYTCTSEESGHDIVREHCWMMSSTMINPETMPYTYICTMLGDADCNARSLEPVFTSLGLLYWCERWLLHLLNQQIEQCWSGQSKICIMWLAQQHTSNNVTNLLWDLHCTCTWLSNVIANTHRIPCSNNTISTVVCVMYWSTVHVNVIDWFVTPGLF